MTENKARRVTLITGASGGMGRACARSFGATNDLILTDISADPLKEFAETLVREGYTIAAAIPGDLSAGIPVSLIDAVKGGGGLAKLIHTAGLSSAQADWRTIMQVNLVATETLLRAIEPLLEHGAAAVLIASAAGHLTPATVEVDALLADPLAPDFLDRLEPEIAAMAKSDRPGALSYVSYGLSKRAMIALCAARAAAWGKLGARIVSISPGLTRTPMGDREAQGNADVGGLLAATPAGRWGTVMDIVAAAQFLASEEASFITGCDLKIDGGIVANFQSQPLTA